MVKKHQQKHKKIWISILYYQMDELREIIKANQKIFKIKVAGMEKDKLWRLSIRQSESKRLEKVVIP